MAKYGFLNKWETNGDSLSHGRGCWKGIMDLLEPFKKAISMEVG